MFLERMAEGVAAVDVISIAPALPFASDVAVFLEVDDDLHCRALGDPDEFGHFSEAKVGRTGNRQQDVGVIGEERPGSSTGVAAHGAIVSTGKPEARTRLHKLQCMK